MCMTTFPCFRRTNQRKMELLLRFLLVALLGLLSGADPATSYYGRSSDGGGYGRKEVVVTNEDRSELVAF